MPEFEAGTFTLGTLLGMLIGAFLGHALAIRRGKYQVKHNAAIEFRRILMPAIIEIERGKNPPTIVAENFNTHYEAAVNYSSYLKGRSLDSFKKDLEKYKKWHKLVCNRSDEQIFYENDDPEYREMLEVGPLKYINQLLKYANT